MTAPLDNSSDRQTSPVCYRHPGRPTRLRCSECGRPICVECSIDGPVGQKCPECSVHSGRGQYVDARRRVGAGGAGAFAAAPVSLSIIIIAVAIHLLRLAAPGFNETVFENGAQANWLVADGEWWRILSAMFLHSTSSFMHILFNMYALFLFGPSLERRVGSVPFAAMYLGSGAAGGAVFYLLNARGLAVGASGAIFGLFGAWLFVSWKTRHTPAGQAQFRNLAVLLAINAALPLFSRSIAWEAHLGGLIAGIAIAAGWARFAVGKPNAVRIRASVAAAVLALSLLAVLVL